MDGVDGRPQEIALGRGRCSLVMWLRRRKQIVRQAVLALASQRHTGAGLGICMRSTASSIRGRPAFRALPTPAGCAPPSDRSSTSKPEAVALDGALRFESRPDSRPSMLCLCRASCFYRLLSSCRCCRLSHRLRRFITGRRHAGMATASCRDIISRRITAFRLTLRKLRFRAWRAVTSAPGISIQPQVITDTMATGTISAGLAFTAVATMAGASALAGRGHRSDRSGIAADYAMHRLSAIALARRAEIGSRVMRRHRSAGGQRPEPCRHRQHARCRLIDLSGLMTRLAPNPSSRRLYHGHGVPALWPCLGR
jgi:hypothetical protein